MVPPLPAAAQSVAPSPSTTLQINTGRGRLINLEAPIDSVFVANDQIADVSVRSPTQIYIFGKGAGETTVYATTKSGRVAYSANIRVGQNLDSIDSMLRLAMPDAEIVATPMNGLVLLTGTVKSPSDVAEAERLVQAFVGKDTQIVSRLQTATPLQVNLQVRFAEVSRSFAKNIGVNLQNRDGGPFTFGVARGRQGSFTYNNGTTTDTNGIPPGGWGVAFPGPTTGGTVIGGAGNILGTTLLGSLDLGETLGQVTTLAQPNLTALSGETATFLAGGEIPIPVPQSGNGGTVITIEYKQYGVSLAFTPTVLSDGRISLRVRPEVSQLSAAGAVTLNNVTIPALTTRRAETSVELGSGESFMIAGLLSNSHDNSIDKAPGLGDVPVLGTLFRSNAWKRNETELVIVITPYLVKPVNANEIALPTDGYKAADDFSRIFGGQLGSGTTGGDRPKPTMAPPQDAPATPTIGALTQPPAPAKPEEGVRPGKAQPPADKKKRKDVAAGPGFGF
ncbi:pilus assembly protein N-terminal domain-containing protein [Sphingomonas canadensis]|nr:pilus assembly protein N-terminal domain-containing protein [Sphingomonas canadensis]MCW3836071.1 pilus assembly protein N-terminal domain-containing protein [Sphingomonas canadensis]